MNVGSCEVREKVELELQAVVSRQLWVLGQRAAVSQPLSQSLQSPPELFSEFFCFFNKQNKDEMFHSNFE